MSMQNMFSPDDQKIMAGSTSDMDKLFKTIEKGLERDLKLVEKLRDVSNQFKKNLLEATGQANKGMPGSGKLGMGEMSRAQRMGFGAAAFTVGGATIGMGMMPNTMSAVNQRMSADAVAGISGLNARQVILRSNAAIGGGATSASGATMAAMNLMYMGGYTATSQTYRNVMPQIGGLSAITGGTNQQMAQGLANVNAMRFLRIGVKARDAQGNLRPPNQIINDTYRFLYGNRKITKEQAAMVLNPGSKGYATISQITGGDQNLMGMIQMGIIARASKGESLTKTDLGNAQRSLDIMGVGQESPLRRLFQYNTSEARKLQATEKGLVGGYNTALDVTTAVNNGFSALAEQADGLTQAFAGLRGFLQTLPGAGNTGATLTGLGGAAVGFGKTAMEFALAKRLLGGGIGSTVAGAAGAGGLRSMLTGGAKFGGKFIPGLGAAIGAYEGYSSAKRSGGFNFGSVAGSFATGFAAGGITGGIASGGLFALPAGLIAGGVSAAANVAGQMFGRGGDCGHGNIGPHSCGQGGDSGKDGAVLQLPVAAGTPVTSEFGRRDNSKNPGISSNHRGIDYGVRENSPIMAAADGVVTHAATHRDYGNYIIIKHGTKSTLYGHLNTIMVKVGQRVSAGQVIAKSGGRKGAPGAGRSTGPHLHFEVRDNGGPEAGGRQNPRGLFGKIFSSIANLFGGGGKKTKDPFADIVRDSRGMSKSGISYTGHSSILSSVPLSQVLNNALVSGAPIGFDDISKEFSKKQLSSGVKNNKGDIFFNLSTDEVSGDKGGMSGGSRKGLMKLLYNVGFRGKALETAFSVALAESGGMSRAHNNTEDYGLFQINMLPGNKEARLAKTWVGADKKKFRLKNINSLYDPVTNAKVAYHMSKHGTNWSSWVTYQKGSFTKFLDEAHSTAQAVGVGGDSGTSGMSLASSSGAYSPASISRSAGSVAMSSKVDITVNMKVNIQRASYAETQRMVNEFSSAIEHELRIKGIGSH